MTDKELELLAQVEPKKLASLDEDELLELLGRIRGARNKWSKLYRRRASAQVVDDGRRSHAGAKHSRTAAKAEVFEDALAKVSRQLAKVAKVSADELRAERLAAARGEAKPGAPTKGKGKPAGSASRTRKPSVTPRTTKVRASTRATNARNQAKRDNRR
ncbi:MAG: hypothetical protein JJU45_14680 [Acidimicrobiia bacterium]|nr:hypothetical protein [Acidimicrobiia bacterium]